MIATMIFAIFMVLTSNAIFSHAVPYRYVGLQAEEPQRNRQAGQTLADLLNQRPARKSVNNDYEERTAQNPGSQGNEGPFQFSGNYGRRGPDLDLENNNFNQEPSQGPRNNGYEQGPRNNGYGQGPSQYPGNYGPPSAPYGGYPNYGYQPGSYGDYPSYGRPPYQRPSDYGPRGSEYHGFKQQKNFEFNEQANDEHTVKFGIANYHIGAIGLDHQTNKQGKSSKTIFREEYQV